MSIKIKDQPFYVQSTAVLLGLVLLVYTMAQLSDILIPLAFAAFLAILLNPICNWLQRHKFTRVWSIVAAMLLAILVVAGVFFFLSTQIIQFGDALPMLEKKFALITIHLKEWITVNFNVPVAKQDQMVKDAIQNSQSMLGKTLETQSDVPSNGASLDRMQTANLGVIMFHNLRVNVLAARLRQLTHCRGCGICALPQ